MSVLADRASGAGVLDRLQVLRSAPTPLRGAPAATWPPSPRTGVRQLRVAGPGLQPWLQDTTTTRTDPAGSTLATPVLGPRNGVHLRYTIVKAYVREKKLGGQEMFIPLAHPPGAAQADFGEALVVIAGVERKAHYLVLDLPHSDDGFVQAFPARDDGGVLRRAQRRVRLLRWGAASHRLRQHQTGGGANSR